MQKHISYPILFKIIVVGLVLTLLQACSQTSVKQNKVGAVIGEIIGASTSNNVKAGAIVQKNRPTQPDFSSDDIPISSNTKTPEMYFRHYGVNPTIDTSVDNVSTFSIDVDTASYSITRAFLKESNLPDPASVRVEEFINNFNYRYRSPKHETFNFHAEAFPSPNRKGYHLLHIGLQGKRISRWKRKPANLIYLVDVSGSMKGRSRLGLLKRAMRLLTTQLRPDDKISIVTFNTSARVILRPTQASNSAAIYHALNRLRASDSTNVEAGLRLAYEIANKHYRNYVTNKIILVSDGVANAGLTTASDIFSVIYEGNKKGIQLNTVGIGMGNYNDVLLEQLAKKGQGMYAYINDMRDARKIFIKRLTGTLQLLARNVKLQLKFNSQVVSRYRLLGYENRMLQNRDFRNDKKDAGEIGAGHAVTAIYEIKLRRDMPRINYFATMRLRYKHPRKEVVREISKRLPMKIIRSNYSHASSYTRLAYIAAAFAEKLRQSYWVRNLSYQELTALYMQLNPRIRNTTAIAELGELIRAAHKLDQRSDKFESQTPIADMNFDHVPVLE